MGYIRHDAIIATSFDIRHIQRARDKAQAFGLPAFGPFTSQMNGYVSIFIPPDGSKEGWEESDKADLARKRWIKWMDDEPELYVDWAQVSFGGDEKHGKVIRFNSAK